MRFQMRQGGVPEGAYKVVFIGIEEFRGNPDKPIDYGPAVILTWRVTEGDCKDEEVSCMCSQKMSSRSKLGKFAMALAGRSIDSGEEINFEDFVGCQGTLQVEIHNDFSRAAGFIRDPNQKPVEMAPDEIPF